MKTFDIRLMQVFPYSDREKNVFYKSDEFKMRIIELKANQEPAECKMKSNVIFFLTKGEVEIMADKEKVLLTKGQCLVSEPAIFSMKAIRVSR